MNTPSGKVSKVSKVSEVSNEEFVEQGAGVMEREKMQLSTAHLSTAAGTKNQLSLLLDLFPLFLFFLFRHYYVVPCFRRGEAGKAGGWNIVRPFPPILFLVFFGVCHVGLLWKNDGLRCGTQRMSRPCDWLTTKIETTKLFPFLSPPVLQVRLGFVTERLCKEQKIWKFGRLSPNHSSYASLLPYFIPVCQLTIGLQVIKITIAIAQFLLGFACLLTGNP